MSADLHQIILPSAPLKKYKKNKTIDTECLYGEKFKIYYTEGLYSYGISYEDKYEGWIKSNSLNLVSNTNYVVSSIRTCVMAEPNVKSEFIFFLPMRSKINVIKIKDDWAKIRLPIKNRFKYGYILKSNILKDSHIKSNWVKYAEKLTSVPYRWGGRDSIGLDCSSLLQLSKAFNGEKIPRDSSDQLKYFKKNKNYIVLKNYHEKDFFRGNIIFWHGHVAIILNKNELIHASAHHGRVVVEKINKTLERLSKNYQLIREDI